ncbi:MAG: hypothetical protein QS748_07845 [Candidatus Endonucleobacter bathymodioli]|uniref:WD domain, G-beta repeat n=1 Tax=Candidatus Endonucleibacter bathymodioli TaxID=539814 RepID=A0AA90NTM0_9GAMM|nr:hypothetical protein [Candidatus Endonucleobacter bathymodioli]
MNIFIFILIFANHLVFAMVLDPEICGDDVNNMNLNDEATNNISNNIDRREVDVISRPYAESPELVAESDYADKFSISCTDYVITEEGRNENSELLLSMNDMVAGVSSIYLDERHDTSVNLTDDRLCDSETQLPILTKIDSNAQTVRISGESKTTRFSNNNIPNSFDNSLAFHVANLALVNNGGYSVNAREASARAISDKERIDARGMHIHSYLTKDEGNERMFQERIVGSSEINCRHTITRREVDVTSRPYAESPELVTELDYADKLGISCTDDIVSVLSSFCLSESNDTAVNLTDDRLCISGAQLPVLKQIDSNSHAVGDGRESHAIGFSNNNIPNSFNNSSAFHAAHPASGNSGGYSINNREALANTISGGEKIYAIGIRIHLYFTKDEYNERMFQDYVYGSSDINYRYALTRSFPIRIIKTFVKQKNKPYYFLAYADEVKVNDFSNDQSDRLYELRGHNGSVNAIIFLDNGQLVTASADKTMKIWAFSTWIRQFYCIQTLSGHSCVINSVIELCGKRLVSVSNDKTIKIWKLNNENEYICIETLIFSRNYKNCWVLSVITASANRLIATSNIGEVKIWQYDENTEKYIYQQMMVSSVFKSWIKSIVEVNKNKLVFGSSHGLLDVWEQSGPTEKYAYVGTLAGHSGDVTSIITTMNGYLVSASTDQTLKVWKQNEQGKYVCMNTLKPNYRSYYFELKSYFHTVREIENGTLLSASGGKIKEWRIK